MTNTKKLSSTPSAAVLFAALESLAATPWRKAHIHSDMAAAFDTLVLFGCATRVGGSWFLTDKGREVFERAACASEEAAAGEVAYRLSL